MAANMRSLWNCFFILSISCCYAQTNGTTESPAATTETPATAAPTPIERNTDMAQCTCDLTANGCDVNCCCDPDCSEDDRLAFSVCIDAFNVVDSQSCVRRDLIYTENSPYLVNTTVPGLFCVQFDNYDSRNYYKAPELVNTTEKFDEYQQKYAPSYSFKKSTEEREIQTDYYRSGDPVYTVFETNALGLLGLPAPLTSQYCADGNPAAYLYDQNLECIRDLTDLATECEGTPALSVLTYYIGFRVITSPEAFQLLVDNSTDSNETVTESPVDALPLFNTTLVTDVVPRGPHLCIDEGDFNNTCSFGDNLPVPSYDGATGTCNNAVVKVLYTITHNGTAGIQSVYVTFTFRNITDALLPLIQGFETDFTREDENSTFRRSGNPGYQAGEPLLAGFLVEQTLEDGSIVQAIELNSNGDNWVTMVSSTVDGTCASDPNNRVAVTFDVGMRSGCFVPIFFSNMTEACVSMQQVIWNALRGPNPPGYIATFGNTPVENVGDWVEIFGVNDDPPSPSPGSGPGICRNVITGLHIEVIYADVGSLANPQPKVIGASYEYHTQDEIRFQCIGAFCQPGNENAMQRIEVVSSVGFVDASSSAVPVSARKPRVTARLPEDFFYPFS